ncbi:hypothetical protein [Pseudorhodobacter ferrugineus]|uniref:hypothetical protein n=1 Tax=Pseudorhodobacter ferrugineus TaxID=77008 RepID=UPI0012DE5A29|nr:hypothetical protein [Pseudorhodobacter ferrugineus]
MDLDSDNSRTHTEPNPAIAGLVRSAFAYLSVLAFFESAFSDLAKQAGVMGHGADIAPVDLVGVRPEVAVAEIGQSRQHGIDVGFRCDKCVLSFVILYSGAARSHGCGSVAELDQSGTVRFAPLQSVINSIPSNFNALI